MSYKNQKSSLSNVFATQIHFCSEGWSMGGPLQYRKRLAWLFRVRLLITHRDTLGGGYAHWIVFCN